MNARHGYDRLAAAQHELPPPGTTDARLALVHGATLGASSHNTQPWRFQIGPDTIAIKPDFARRCPVVDPDDSHLHKSLGCAAENVLAAAPAYGFHAEAEVCPGAGGILVHLDGTKPVGDASALKVISARQSTKLPYDGRPLPADETAALAAAGAGAGGRVILVEDGPLRDAITDLVLEGNRAQLADPAFRRELIAWIRFNPASAMRWGDGLAGRAGGQPPLPDWLGPRLMRFVLTPAAQNRRDAANLRSSGGIAVFVADADDPRPWMETGRSYERVALAATARGIRTAFVNQPIEVRPLRSRLHALLGLSGGEMAHLMVRYGHGPLAPYSLRRPVDDVIDRN